MTALRLDVPPRPLAAAWAAFALCTGCSGQARLPAASPATVAASGAGQVVDQVDPRIWCIHDDASGHRWFGSNGAGVFRWDGERLTRYTTDDGLAGDQVRAIVDDGRGGVLVTTTEAVSRFDGRGWTDVPVVVAGPAPDGWRLDERDVWLTIFGSNGPGRFDGERITRLSSPPNPEPKVAGPDARAWWDPNDVFTLHQDRRGHVWVGTAAAGLYRYDGTSFGWYEEERLSVTPSGGAFGIRAILDDADGDVWICNTRQRFRFEEDTDPIDSLDAGVGRLRSTVLPGLPDAADDDADGFTYFMAIAQHADGVLWMACGSDGPWSWDGREVTRHDTPDDAYAIDVALDADGGVSIATLQHGVLRLAPERVGDPAGFRPWRPAPAPTPGSAPGRPAPASGR